MPEYAPNPKLQAAYQGAMNHIGTPYTPAEINNLIQGGIPGQQPGQQIGQTPIGQSMAQAGLGGSSLGGMPNQLQQAAMGNGAAIGQLGGSQMPISPTNSPMGSGAPIGALVNKGATSFQPQPMSASNINTPGAMSGFSQGQGLSGLPLQQPQANGDLRSLKYNPSSANVPDLQTPSPPPNQGKNIDFGGDANANYGIASNQIGGIDNPPAAPHGLETGTTTRNVDQMPPASGGLETGQSSPSSAKNDSDKSQSSDSYNFDKSQDQPMQAIGQAPNSQNSAPNNPSNSVTGSDDQSSKDTLANGQRFSPGTNPQDMKSLNQLTDAAHALLQIPEGPQRQQAWAGIIRPMAMENPKLQQAFAPTVMPSSDTLHAILGDQGATLLQTGMALGDRIAAQNQMYHNQERAEGAQDYAKNVNLQQQMLQQNVGLAKEGFNMRFQRDLAMSQFNNDLYLKDLQAMQPHPTTGVAGGGNGVTDPLSAGAKPSALPLDTGTTTMPMNKALELNDAFKPEYQQWATQAGDNLKSYFEKAGLSGDQIDNAVSGLQNWKESVGASLLETKKALSTTRISEESTKLLKENGVINNDLSQSQMDGLIGKHLQQNYVIQQSQQDLAQQGIVPNPAKGDFDPQYADKFQKVYDKHMQDIKAWVAKQQEANKNNNTPINPQSPDGRTWAQATTRDFIAERYRQENAQQENIRQQNLQQAAIQASIPTPQPQQDNSQPQDINSILQKQVANTASAQVAPPAAGGMIMPGYGLPMGQNIGGGYTGRRGRR